ncbi:hypothetical protein CesoFtcFv8_005549 [Champsocephalus esox]|uniref:Uncharacterized protein n=1 Tax=Champsocephalus esox TaxID=159716 RepID=A0AAN8HA63_9TELE|nr:hypothetical protein CesoFtcFv8_005549 [Champsocephalus esox]
MGTPSPANSRKPSRIKHSTHPQRKAHKMTHPPSSSSHGPRQGPPRTPRTHAPLHNNKATDTSAHDGPSPPHPREDRLHHSHPHRAPKRHITQRSS